MPRSSSPSRTVTRPSAAMVAAQVIGNDTAITLGGASGNFELNVMLPLIARNLLESIVLLANVSQLLADKAVATFKVNEQNLQAALARNPILVTALNPLIGYEKAAALAKEAFASGKTIRELCLEKDVLAEETLKEALDPWRMTEPQE